MAIGTDTQTQVTPAFCQGCLVSYGEDESERWSLDPETGRRHACARRSRLKKMVSPLFSCIIALAFAVPCSGAWSDCASHVCTSVGCSIAAIEAFESSGTRCANWGWSGGQPTSPASGTVCARGESLGSKEIIAYLNCANGDCRISGNFKCPQPGGVGYGSRPVDLTCPSRNLGGTVHSPRATITSEYNPELGAYGPAAHCSYPDGMLFASCDSSGNVGYGTTF